jgi:drug/metabolite transporter (DMT)-like permease
MKQLTKRVWAADLLLLLAAFIWGTTFVAQKMGTEHLGVFSFNSFRFLIGGMAMLPILIWRRFQSDPKEFWKTVKLSIPAGIILFLGINLQQFGLMYTDSGPAGFITGIYVVMVPFLLIFRKPVKGMLPWIAALLTFFGLYLINGAEGFTFNIGNLLVFLATPFWALHIVYIGEVVGERDALVLAIPQYLLVALLSFIGAYFFEEFSFAAVTEARWALLYAALLSTAIGFTLQLIAQKFAPPHHAAIIMSMESVFAALGGVVVLGETMNLPMLVGSGVILLSMILSQWDVFQMRKKALKTV